MLNTQHFDTIVRFFKLQDYVDYFRLFNNTKYMNAYHGYEHMKRVVCSVVYLCNYYGFEYEDTLYLCLAAIFHDFNYISASNDAVNIQYALKAFKNFYIDYYPKEGNECIRNRTYDIVTELIQNTLYPECLTKEFGKWSAILISADHSMVLYPTYPYMGSLICLHEFDLAPEKSALVEKFRSYYNSVTFPEKVFARMWNEDKTFLMEETDEFFNGSEREIADKLYYIKYYNNVQNKYAIKYEYEVVPTNVPGVLA